MSGFNNTSGHPLSPKAQVLTATGAIDVDARHVSLNVADGTYAVTLAAPSEDQLGMIKVIEMDDDTGTSVTLALTNVRDVPTSHTLATFDAEHEHLVLVAGLTSWRYLAGTAGLSTP
jgi:hypothetical protein